MTELLIFPIELIPLICESRLDSIKIYEIWQFIDPPPHRRGSVVLLWTRLERHFGVFRDTQVLCIQGQTQCQSITTQILSHVNSLFVEIVFFFLAYVDIERTDSASWLFFLLAHSFEFSVPVEHPLIWHLLVVHKLCCKWFHAHSSFINTMQFTSDDLSAFSLTFPLLKYIFKYDFWNFLNEKICRWKVEFYYSNGFELNPTPFFMFKFQTPGNNHSFFCSFNIAFAHFLYLNIQLACCLKK